MVACGPGERIDARPYPITPRHAAAGRRFMRADGGKQLGHHGAPILILVGAAAPAAHEQLGLALPDVEAVTPPTTPARADILLPARVRG